MKSALLYVLAALMLALIVSVAWWTRLAEQPQHYVIGSGDTVESISAAYDVEIELLAEANGTDEEDLVIVPGESIMIPAAPATGANVWLAHGAGIGAEIGGVLLSFWLSLVAGLLPRGYRKQMFGISAALGLASYAGSHAGVEQAISLTPGFLFDAIKDGFMWAAAFPMFAAAFGMRDRDGAGSGAFGRKGSVAPEPVESSVGDSLE